MGTIQSPPLVRPMAGILVSLPELWPDAEREMTGLFGPIAQATEPLEFKHTDYYAKEMGSRLWRRFLVFRGLRPAGELAGWKRATNALEARLGGNRGGGRRVNVDPGYLAPGKLVLASTKDHAHRVYLGDGIFGEVTLRFLRGRFCAWEWTYPDYAAAAAFFDEAYRDYRQVLKAARGAVPDAG